MAPPLKSYIKDLGFSLKGLIYAVIVAIDFVQVPKFTLGVEPGKPSWTAENNAAYRAIAALDPDPTIRNPDYLAEKKRRVAEIIGSVPDNVAYVPIDFNKQTLGEVLKRAGYDEKLETFFIWEGVIMYIEEDAVDSTIRFIAQNSAPGSSVVFDYVFRGIIEGKTKDLACTRAMTKVAMKGESWIFGTEKSEADANL